MAKSRLRPNRGKYYHDTKKEWLFGNKSNILLIIFGIILTLVAIAGLVGAILKYFRLLSK